MENELSVIVRAIIAPFEAGMAQAAATLDKFTVQANAESAKVEAAGARMGGAFKGIMAGLAPLIGLAVAGGAVAFLANCYNEAVRAKDAMNEAANSIRNMGGALNVGEMQAYLTTLSTGMAAGVASTNELYDGMQVLAEKVRSTGQLERVMADATELAARNHISFEAAANLVSKALQGNIGALTRAGVVTKDEAKALKDTVPEAHQVEALMELLEKKTRNATAALDPNTVALGRMKNEMANARIEIGDALMPAMLKLITGTGDLTSAVDQLKPYIQAAVVAVADLAAVALGLAGGLEHLAATAEHAGAVVAHAFGAIAAGAHHDIKGAMDQIGAMKDQYAALQDQMAAGQGVFKLPSYADIYGNSDLGPVVTAKTKAAFAAAWKTERNLEQANPEDDLPGGTGTGLGTGKGKTKHAPTEAQISKQLAAVDKWFDEQSKKILAAFQQIGDKQIAALQKGFDYSPSVQHAKDKLADLENQKAMYEAGGGTSVSKLADYDRQIDETKIRLADLAVQAAQTAVNIGTKYRLPADKMAELESKLVDAKRAEKDAVDAMAVSALKAKTEIDKLAQAAAHSTNLGEQAGAAGGSLLARAMPGAAKGFTDAANAEKALEVATKGSSDAASVFAAGLKGGLIGLLIEAFEKTKVFGQLMQMLGFIMSEVAKAIDFLLKPLSWLLSLLGFHADASTKDAAATQAATAALTPFIKIKHDIPTLNELASGKNIATSQNYMVANNIPNPAHFEGPVNRMAQAAAQIQAAADAFHSKVTGAADHVARTLSAGASKASEVFIKGVTPSHSSTMTNHFHGDIRGYDDVEKLGRDLADTAARQARTRAYDMGRTAV